MFDATHVEVRRWFTEGLVDGLRIDHPDGLSDPAGYLARLRELDRRRRLHRHREDPRRRRGAGADPARRRHHRLRRAARGRRRVRRPHRAADAFGTRRFRWVRPRRGGPADRRLKTEAATDTLSSELGRLRRSVVAAAGADHPLLPDAITALLTNIDVYRCDYPSLSAMMSTALADTVSARPELAAPLALVTAALEHPEPAAADPAVVRGGHRQGRRGLPVLPRSDTGVAQRGRRRTRPVRGQRRGVPPQRRGAGAALADRHDDADHPRHQARRRRARPDRGAVPGARAVGRDGRRLGGAVPRPRPGDRTVPVAEHLRCVAGLRDRRRRAAATTARLRREGDPRGAPAHLVERPGRRLRSGGARLAGRGDRRTGRRRTDALVGRLDPHARNDALGQKLLALTVPGVPDVYQGTELWEDSLVDPDNRRPVDFDVRRAALDAGRPSQDPGGARRRCDCVATGRRRSWRVGTHR